MAAIPVSTSRTSGRARAQAGPSDAGRIYSFCNGTTTEDNCVFYGRDVEGELTIIRVANIIFKSTVIIECPVGANHIPAPSSPYVDYTKLPKNKVASWPEVVPHGGLLGGVVWGNMMDYMRRVSAHVSIGRAHRGNPRKPTNDYFTLVRKDVA